MKARAYPVPNVDLMQPATLVQADLARDHDVRMLPLQGRAGLVVEVRRMNSLLQRGAGTGAVLKAWFQPTPGGFSVSIGTDRIEDATLGAVEWLLNTPAMITEGYAAFRQAQVDERIFRTVEHWVSTVARVRGPAAVPSTGPCPQCRTPLPYGARFCPRCAFDTQGRGPAAACPECKGAIALDAAFCPHCGKRVSAVQAAKNACRKCSAELEPDAKFCSGCGAAQDAEKEGSPS